MTTEKPRLEKFRCFIEGMMTMLIVCAVAFALFLMQNPMVLRETNQIPDVSLSESDFDKGYPKQTRKNMEALVTKISQSR